MVSYHITICCHDPVDGDLNLHRRENLECRIKVQLLKTFSSVRKTRGSSRIRKDILALDKEIPVKTVHKFKTVGVITITTPERQVVRLVQNETTVETC